MKFELRRLARNCTNEEIIAEIKRVDSLIKKDVLTQSDFDNHAKISSSTTRKRFGSWRKALIAAGLEHKYSARPEFQKIRGQKFTDDEIIAELQRIAKLLGKESVTMEEFMQKSGNTIHAESVRRRFGSWATALKKAGLKIVPLGRRYSLEDYFENLLNVWTHYGRQPFHREMDEYPSTISSGAYEGRFGSWRKALEAFVLRMNEGEVESSEEVNFKKTIAQSANALQLKRQTPKRKTITPKAENRRGINLSLRYKVLVRDNFRCISCGKSPATSPGVELHIDHKTPFSKGGRTVLDNLQTLCDKCNLGKGNRHFK